MKALAEQGPLPIPKLLTSTRAGLTAVLHAIRDLQQFRLIEFIPEDDRLRLTASGSGAATAIRDGEIRHSAERMLSE